MKRLLLAFMVLALPIAAAVAAAEKAHMAVPGDQECSECHVEQDKDWFEGKHGLMNVKCIACHGSTDKNFVGKPGNSRCLGCHGEQVDQATAKATKPRKTCFSCHDNHSLAVKTELKAPFHPKGGR